MITPAAHGQDGSREAAVEAEFRANLAAWTAGDMDAILSGNGSRVGFGYCPLAPRGVQESDVEWSRELLSRFFESLAGLATCLEPVQAASSSSSLETHDLAGSI
jgi:hypothetical protein